MKSSGTRVHSVAKAVSLLVALADPEVRERTPRALAEHTGIPVPTVYHLLNTLQDADVVARDVNRRYVFGPTVAHIAETFYRDNAAPEFLLTAVRRLAEETGESAYFSAWRQGKIRMIASTEGSHAVHVAQLHAGYGGVAHARASGKLLLALFNETDLSDYLRANPLERVAPHTITDEGVLRAELARIRERGYSTDEEEFLEGVGCYSMAIHRRGHLYGALTISAPIDRFHSRSEELLAALQESVNQLEVSAGAAVATGSEIA